MLPLLETVIGFVAIMLVLSFLVKSLTSMVKSHFNYYSENLKREVERLVWGTVGKTLEQCHEKAPWLKGVQWERLGDEFLSRENIEWILWQVTDDPGKLEKELKRLEARLKVHRANVSYAFEMRTKNLSLMAGLVLCLGLNINAFTIWDTLYNDQAVRAKFASPEAVEALEKQAEETERKLAESSAGPPTTRQELEKQRDEVRKVLAHFRSEVGFGMGRIWTEGPPKEKDKAKQETAEWRFFGYEFFGSLLTGLLVSVGAPYWHDLLRALASLRGWGKGEAAAGAAPGGQTAGAGGGSGAGSSD